MKKSTLVAAIVFMLSCNNGTTNTSVNKDSINNNIDNTKTMLDTIANGDTTSYNRMNDLIKDSTR